MERTDDYLIRGTALDGKVRVFAALTTALVDELRRRHDVWPTAAAALGRTATAGALMGSMLKGKEKLTIQVKGDGPLGTVMVDANADGDVRGYVGDPHVHLAPNAKGKLDVAGAVGTSGHIHIIKDLGLKEPYRGASPIVSGELAEDFTYYFSVSEQTPSAVALGVLVNPDHSVQAAGGFVIQLLPGLDDDGVAAIERKLADLPPVTALIGEGLGPEHIAQRLFGDFRLLDSMSVRFKCSCSKARVEQTLISLGEAEIAGIIEDTGQAEVSCHFCNEAYVLEKEELQRLVEQHFH